MSSKEYAVHRGCHPSLVSKWKSSGALQGALVKVEGQKRVLIDSEKADQLLSKNLDPSKSRKPVPKKPEPPPGETEPSNDPSYIDARTWNARYQAAARKLDYEIKAGQYVLRSEVRDGVIKAGKIFKDQLLNVAPRVAAIVASMDDEHEVLQIINKEILEALGDLVRALNSAAKGGI